MRTEKGMLGVYAYRCGVYAYRCGVYLSDTPQAKKNPVLCKKMRKNLERNQNTERLGERKTEIESVRRV